MYIYMYICIYIYVYIYIYLYIYIKINRTLLTMPLNNEQSYKQVKQTDRFHSYRVKETFQIFFIYSNGVYANFSTLEKVSLLSTSTSIIIEKVLNHKPQFWRVKISRNKTIIFKNMLNSR